MFFMLKNKKYILLMFQNITRMVKTSYSFNDSKSRMMPLSSSKKTISVIKKKNVKTPRWFSSQLPSLFCN